ncbi:MAG: transglycosylase SLT domain-containing protein [Caldilineaceae bacterium]
MSQDHDLYDEELNPTAEEASIDKLPPVLRNWQVIEIDGEATRVQEESVSQPEMAIVQEGVILDHPDEVIVVGLDERTLRVNAGETAPLQITLLNNGDRTALFTLYVEGWVNEQWIAVVGASDQVAGEALPLHIRLNQGERATVKLALTPPRSATVRAGEYAFAIVARSAAYPERFHRVGAMLQVQPYVELTLGQIRPQPLAFSWLKRTHAFVLPLTNQSNTAVSFRLHAPDARRQWQVEFRTPPIAQKQSRLTLQPGQKAQVPVQARARGLALFGVDKQNSNLRLGVAPVGELGAPRVVNVAVTRAPLLGPWHLVAFFSLAAAVIMGVSLVGITGLMLWHSSIASARAKQAALVPTPALLPMIALVVNVPVQAQAALAPVDKVTQQNPQPPSVLSPTSAAPMVRADQVTGPGTPAPTPAPVVAVATPRPAPMHKLTYQQMFQEIGRRYDLNWRILAAQAYVESSFDSAALGRKGTLGLMQVMPDTWREWAPVVKVTDPFDTYSNVLVASVYLDYLRTTLSKHGQTQFEWALVAYSWGIDKVVKHLDQKLGWDDLPQESRQYAEDVMRIAETIPTR